MTTACRTHLWLTYAAGQWCDIGDASLHDALEAAFAANSDGYRFNAGGNSYEIDFDRMKQVNLSTKRERDVRRVPDPCASFVSNATVTQVTPAVVTKPKTVVPKTVAPKTVVPKTVVPKTVPKTVVPMTVVPTTVVPKTVVPKTAAGVPKITAVPKIAAVTTKIATAASVPAAARPPALCKPVPSAVPALPRGQVTRFLKEKGYGFIALNGQEVFFHVSVLEGDSIKANDIVEVVTARGGSKPRATLVRVVRSGSIFRQMCRNKCCKAMGERHFEDRCPRGGFKYEDDDDDASTACS